MKLISIIWLIFTVLFSYLSYFHYQQSRVAYPHFEVTEIKGIKIMAGDMSIEQPLKDFANKFNEYLDKQNKSNKKQHKLTGFGYLAASFIAFISFLLTFNKTEKYANKKCNLNPYTYFKNCVKRFRE